MPKFNSLAALQTALRTGETSCREVVLYYLAQVEKHRQLNAYVEVWADEALASADALDARLAAAPDSLGKLFGAVVSLKDNICYAGHQVTAASKILEGFTSQYSATAVERILAEDAIIIGRTNCDQFGMGSSNENSVYGPVRNAADPSCVPGGSSGERRLRCKQIPAWWLWAAIPVALSGSQRPFAGSGASSQPTVAFPGMA